MADSRMPVRARDRDLLDQLIERLRRRHAAWAREFPNSREVELQWTLVGARLHYHVVLEDIAEPDLDIEITPEALVIRAMPSHREPALLLGVLPVPPSFDPMRPRIRFEFGYLEIEIHPSSEGGQEE
ncbi:MAG: hypothetical protein AB7O52_04820 [Planctomycetota bacterium]